MVIRVGEAATSSEKMTSIMFMQETGILKTSRFFSFGFYQRFSLYNYVQQARKSDETQEAETTPQQSNVPDDDSNLLPLHSPKLEEHGMPDKAEKSQSTIPDDDSNLLPFYPSKSEEHGVPDKAKKSQSTIPDNDSNLLPFHFPKSEGQGVPDQAEKSQSNVPDDDSTLTPNRPQKCRKRGVADKAEERRASSSSLSYGTAALVLFLLTFTAGVCPGDMCDVQAMAVTSKGKVAITCPLSADVNKTIQTIVIKNFKPLTNPENALECDREPSEQNFSCMWTRFKTELIAYKSQVLASLPPDRLENGTYRCQLVPPGPELFTDCIICKPEDPKTVSPTEASKTTGAPKPLPVTLGQRELGEPREKASARSVDPKQQISVHRAGGQYGGLVAAVVMLSITVFFLLLAIAAMVVFFLHYKRTMKQADKRTPEETVRFTSGEETV